MADTYTFGQESYFNENVTFFKDINVSNTFKIISGNLILVSPNGTNYKISVSDAGVISATIFNG